MIERVELFALVGAGRVGQQALSRLLGPGCRKRPEHPLSPGRRPSTTNGARACRAWRTLFPTRESGNASPRDPRGFRSTESK